MKKKFQRAFVFVSLAIFICFLFVGCNKKPSKHDQSPIWKTTWWAIIRDYQYLQRTFYDLGYSNDFTYGDSIVEIKLFKSNPAINSNTGENPAPFGMAYVDPNDTLTLYPEGPYLRRFAEIDPSDYFVQRSQNWVQFFHPLDHGDLLAAFYVVLHSNGNLDTVGFIKDSCTGSEDEICYRLKLIKPDDARPTDYTWEYEWKNVYFLTKRDINKEEFRLQIYKGPLQTENIQIDSNTRDGISYLRIFGLDQMDSSGNIHPDGMVDSNRVDYNLGYLFFPNCHPFAPYPNVSFTETPKDTLKEMVNAIYNSNNIFDWLENSKYYIYVELGTWVYPSQ